MNNIRIIHNLKNVSEVDIYINKKKFSQNIGYQNITAYQNIKKSEFRFDVKLSGTNNTILSSFLNLNIVLFHCQIKINLK